MAESFQQGGQQGWFHDPGYWGGYFHSYSDFRGANGSEPPRQLHIFLPRDYQVSGDRYPVLYMNDGDTVFFPGGPYQKTWDMARRMTRLYLGYQIRKIILVAVCPLKRDYEYTHAPVYGREWGGLDDYSMYLAHSVKAFIDTHYRTLPDAKFNAIAGASEGGLAAFYTAAQYPDKFGNCAALSPAFWVGLDSGVELSFSNFSGPFFGDLKTSALLFNLDAKLRERALKLYLDWGLVRSGGFHNEFFEERATVRGREMRDLLIREFGYRQNINLFTVEDPTGEHCEESWSERMEYVLKLFFGI